MSQRKVAVVTGGASGIGLATVATLSQQGDIVVLADVNEAAARERAAEFGDAVTAAHLDVTVEDSVAELFAHTLAEHGRIDTVVNCAGLSIPGAIADLELADWETTIGVCQTGTFLVLKYAARHVSDGGSVVCIASLNGRQPGTGLAAYCAAKAAVLMLTEVAAMELALRKIRVNAISPGLVETPLVAGIAFVPGLHDEYVENTPLGRAGTAEEVADVVAFLASDKAGWMTGAAIDLNGGAHTKRYPDVLGRVRAMANQS
ncbi:SDR family NAD(P)-dependent oxidoreductase [Aldersonia kunmingensis]|uniref:SDR family NAD(P)-dependent oxidoreductase n=1 Tax=Aldersonia kunmingensis TaxID=408066 RepID=UPI000A7A77E2|nr:SDR family NAD(P)-dependent oxidoreductase [Aldersonia kunmingensis]